MEADNELGTSPTKNETTIEQTSECETVVTRMINATPETVFRAWTDAELFQRWWVPKSYGLNLVSCVMDVRVGGEYRLGFLVEGSTMEFFGTYVEVEPPARLVWTNDEGDAGQTVTTVTFAAVGDQTRIVIHDRYPSKDAMESGATGAMPETLDQLEEFLAGMGSGA